MEQAEIKERTAKAAVEALVRSGMRLGLGTGSTAVHAVRHIGALLAQGRLRDIAAVPTSMQTAMECERRGVPLCTLDAAGGALDLAIDGADEVDGRNRCVKGGGGALLLEKIAAYAAKVFCVIVDESKLVEHLALRFPLPVEVVPEARVSVTRALEAALKARGGAAEIVLREAVRKAGPVITEHGNLLLDLRLTAPSDPALLEAAINGIPGVVENGFFTRPAVVYIGHAGGAVEARGAGFCP